MTPRKTGFIGKSFVGSNNTGKPYVGWIEGSVSPDVYLVAYKESPDADYHPESRLVKVGVMLAAGWSFYANEKDLREAYNRALEGYQDGLDNNTKAQDKLDTALATWKKNKGK